MTEQEHTYSWGEITCPDSHAILGYWCKIERYNGLHYGQYPSVTPFYGYGDSCEKATTEARRKLKEDGMRARHTGNCEIEVGT